MIFLLNAKTIANHGIQGLVACKVSFRIYFAVFSCIVSSVAAANVRK